LSPTTYRPAPPLLEQTGPAVEAFVRLFRPSGTFREIRGPGARIAAFDAKNVGSYSEFFKAGRRDDPLLGSPSGRLSWVDETLHNPDEVWRRSDSPRDTEFFLSRFRLADGKDVLFIVICRATDQETGIRLEPRRTLICQARDDSEWTRLRAGARRLYPEEERESTELGAERSTIRVGLCFGSTTMWIDKRSWERRFEQLEEQHPVRFEVEYCEAMALPKRPAECWLLDTNTTAAHKDFDHKFNERARQAGAYPLPVESPSQLRLVFDGATPKLTSSAWNRP